MRWLSICFALQGTWVRAILRELRPHVPRAGPEPVSYNADLAEPRVNINRIIKIEVVIYLIFFICFYLIIESA